MGSRARAKIIMLKSPSHHLPDMIMSRTPLRVSFAGGGTDLPDFYSREFGAVLSTTINKFIYVTVKKHGALFGEDYRLNYSISECVKDLSEMKNSIARECLRLVPVRAPIYISTVADIPASSGLGSSSSFAVGLLNALHAFRGESVTAGQLAEEAAHIEIDVLKNPIGKQDHYAAAFGGLNYFNFQKDGRVSLEPQTLTNQEIKKLFGHLQFFWTGIERAASSVLGEQKQRTANNMDYLVAMREHASHLREMFFDRFNPQKFGQILDESWQMKRQLASSISSSQIDRWLGMGKSAGAMGGKICGAGGGGFLCFVVAPSMQPKVSEVLGKELTEVHFDYESQGSRLLFEV